VGIAISISIIVTLWTSGIISGYMGISRLDVIDKYGIRYGDYYLFIIHVKNDGTRSLTIDNIFVDNKPYKASSYRVFVFAGKNINYSFINGKCLYVNAWAYRTGNPWGLHTYLYYGFKLITNPYTIKSSEMPGVLNLTVRLRYSLFKYSLTSNLNIIPASLLHVDPFLFGISMETMDIYNILHNPAINVYYDIANNDIIVNSTYDNTWGSSVSYFVHLNYSLVDNKWHTITVLLYIYADPGEWTLKILIDGNTLMDVKPFPPANAISYVELEPTGVPGQVLPLTFPTSIVTGFYQSGTYNYPVIESFNSTFLYRFIYFKYNNNLIYSTTFDNSSALANYYWINQTVSPPSLIYQQYYVWKNITKLENFTPKSLPYTINPGQNATLVLVVPANKVSPGTMYSIIIHTANGDKYPVTIILH